MLGFKVRNYPIRLLNEDFVITDSEYPDEMSRFAASYLDFYCLLLFQQASFIVNP